MRNQGMKVKGKNKHKLSMLAPIKNWRGYKEGDEKEENMARYPGSNFMSYLEWSNFDIVLYEHKLKQIVNSTSIHLDVFFCMSRSAKCHYDKILIDIIDTMK